MTTEQAYTNTEETLKTRILAMIPGHPEILTMDGPWGLLKVDGFVCDDLSPTLAQAGWALGAARKAYREGATP